MKILIRSLVALVVLVSGSAAYAQEYVKVGSWNIEHLGSRTFGQHPIALAEHLRLAGVDVLALQEIYDTDDNQNTRKNSKLDEAFSILNQQTGQNWEYLLFPNKDQSDTSQLCGVAWNKAKVSKVGEHFRIPVVDNPNDEFKTWDRHPHAVKFSALGTNKTDFVVIPVHMKSNVDGASFGRNQRAAEATALAAKLGAVTTHFADQDVIIIGDTNCLDAAEDALAKFLNAGFKDLNSSDLPTFADGKAPFDRIIVPRTQQEFNFSQQYALIATDSQAHDRSLSDHFLVMAVFKVVSDDD